VGRLHLPDPYRRSRPLPRSHPRRHHHGPRRHPLLRPPIRQEPVL
jgi:hypothetical protein